MNGSQPHPQPYPQPYPQPGSAPGPMPGAPPQKKSKTGCILAGCGGCLVVVLGVCGLGGYLAYLEEGVSYSDPGEEVTSQPYIPGTPFQITYTFDGSGYATHRVYVDLGASAGYDTQVTGEVGCMEYGSMNTRPISESLYYSPPGHPGWVQVFDTYDRATGTPIACQGTLQVSPPVPTARIVVTRRQRPSDWLGAAGSPVGDSALAAR